MILHKECPLTTIRMILNLKKPLNALNHRYLRSNWTILNRKHKLLKYDPSCQIRKFCYNMNVRLSANLLEIFR